MEQPKPIKRSKELAPLSREHHEGLLFGWKIRQGLRNGTDNKTLLEFADWFWHNDLKEHFRKEEEVLAPLLPAENDLVKRMFAEHEEIESLIAGLTQNGNENALLKLADVVHDHIRFEERELFPFAETFVAKEDLDKIHGELEAHTKEGVWENEFWVRK